jgi:hypothetical protein
MVLTSGYTNLPLTVPDALKDPQFQRYSPAAGAVGKIKDFLDTTIQNIPKVVLKDPKDTEEHFKPELRKLFEDPARSVTQFPHQLQSIQQFKEWQKENSELLSEYNVELKDIVALRKKLLERVQQDQETTGILSFGTGLVTFVAMRVFFGDFFSYRSYDPVGNFLHFVFSVIVSTGAVAVVRDLREGHDKKLPKLAEKLFEKSVALIKKFQPENAEAAAPQEQEAVISLPKEPVKEAVQLAVTEKASVDVVEDVLATSEDSKSLEKDIPEKETSSLDSSLLGEFEQDAPR